MQLRSDRELTYN